MKEMYQLTATQVMKHFNSPIDGLTSTQAEERRRTSGWNELTAAKSKPQADFMQAFIQTFMETFSGTISGFSCNHSHYCGNHIRTAW